MQGCEADVDVDVNVDVKGTGTGTGTRGRCEVAGGGVRGAWDCGFAGCERGGRLRVRGAGKEVGGSTGM